MKTIGLIGGMSWESSAEYYRIINQTTKKQLGGLHSAPIVMYSVEFNEIVRLQHEGKWDELTAIMVDAAKRLERAGADLVLICTNTMHKMASEVEHATSLPLLHIADATATRIKEKRLKRVALLGTRFTMEQDFYKGRLAEKHGLDVIVPSAEDREIVHRIIYNELCQGTILDSSRKEYLRIINNLVSQGAEGVILGCTEIPLLVKQADIAVPIFDTTTIHAQEAVKMALAL
jgi:aspartate racemase